MCDAILYVPNETGGSRTPMPIPVGKEFTIGRSYTASLDLPKFEVSRLHCVIKDNNEAWTICDKSSFGTSVNGVRLVKNEITNLNDGDKITISTLKNLYVFCSGESCPNNCKDVSTEKIVSDEDEDEECKELERSIRRSKTGMQELRSLHTELNEKLNLQLHGLKEKFQEQLKSQTPDQIKLLKDQMEKEKAEIQEKYSKEVAELGERLEKSQEEQETLRQQIDMLFEARGRDSDSLRELSDDLDQLKREKESMGEINITLEKRVKEMSEAIEAEKENVKKQCLDSIGDIMESELQCCICNELFVKATTINCSHTFCEKCINSWLRNNNVCPMCRATVTSRTRSLVIDTYIDKMIDNLSQELKERRRTLVRERDEEAKTAPPPPPIVQAIRPTLPEVITVRTVNGGIQVVPNSIRLSNAVRIIHPNLPGGIRPRAQGAPVVVRAQVVQPGAQDGRNVRPRLPNTPAPAVIDLTSSGTPRHQHSRHHHSQHRRRH